MLLKFQHLLIILDASSEGSGKIFPKPEEVPRKNSFEVRILLQLDVVGKNKVVEVFGLRGFQKFLYLVLPKLMQGYQRKSCQKLRRYQKKSATCPSGTLDPKPFFVATSASFASLIHTPKKARGLGPEDLQNCVFVRVFLMFFWSILRAWQHFQQNALFRWYLLRFWQHFRRDTFFFVPAQVPTRFQGSCYQNLGR